MTQEAQDQLGRDAVGRVRFGHCIAQAADHRADLETPLSERLRVEEQLGMDDTVGGGACEIRAGELGEVGALAQDRTTRVIQIEKRLQIAEAIGGAHLVDSLIRELDAVVLRETEHQLGLERALDVEVELDLGQPGDQAGAARIQRHEENIPIARPYGRGYGRDPDMTDENPAPKIDFDPVPALAFALALPRAGVAAVVAMLDEGNTVPFIARYRKERTGGLDEAQIRAIEERRSYLVELEERRAAILASVTEQGKLTPELEQKLRGATGKGELEDLYTPYRPRRKTRASMARDKGLQPLAELIAAQGDGPLDAAAFITE